MNFARPTVAEERALLLAARYPALRVAVERSGLTGDWKSTTGLGRGLGFLLGLLGAFLLGGALSLFPSTLLLAGLVLVAAAEYLVSQRRVVHSGVEEALYLCGAIGIVVQLLIWSSGRNEAAGVAGIATAVLFVGWRLRNPLFTTLAAALYSLAIALAGAHLSDGNLHTLVAAVACALFACGALIAGQRTWRRPSHDRMLDGLVIVMPWLGFAWLTTIDSDRPVSDHLALALALCFLVANLFVGLRRREHAPLIGALGNLACVGYGLNRLWSWPLHWQLLVFGTMLLVAAVALERLLRARNSGITSREIDEPAGIDLLQVAGAAHLAPAPGAAPSAGAHGQGGDFGGGGASGRF